jgi:hypothetical protein
VDFIGTKQNKQITFLHRLMYSLQLLFSIVKICQKVKLKIKNSKMKFFCRFSIVRSEKNERKNLQIPIFSFQCSQIFTTSKLLPRNPLLPFPFESYTFFWVMHLKLGFDVNYTHWGTHHTHLKTCSMGITHRRHIHLLL